LQGALGVELGELVVIEQIERHLQSVPLEHQSNQEETRHVLDSGSLSNQVNKIAHLLSSGRMIPSKRFQTGGEVLLTQPSYKSCSHRPVCTRAKPEGR
jgi:hypothetical protein